MTPLFYAKIGAVLSVFYAGTNVFQLWAGLEEIRQRARQFAEVAADPGNALRLRLTRLFFYAGVPLMFLGAFTGAGLQWTFLYAVSAKFSVSALLGMAVERRLLRGEEYRFQDHLLSRLDAALNIAMAGAAIVLLLGRRY